MDSFASITILSHVTVRRSLLLAVIPLAALFGCAEDADEIPDYTLERIRRASQLTLDAQTTAARTLTREETRAFLADFERDTFAPGPHSTRMIHGCRRGTMMVGGVVYPFAYCRLKNRREVLEIGMEEEVLRLVKSIEK